MVTRAGSPRQRPDAVSAVGQRADGATLAGLYLLALLIVPARLVLSFVPITLPPALVVALGLGVLWFGGQMANTLGMGKGRNAVRTALAVYLSAHLITYAIATRRSLPEDELHVADSSLVRITATVAVAVFICDALRNRDRLDRLLKVLLGSITVVASVGLVQFALGVDLVALVNLPGLRVQENTYAAFEHRSIFRRPAGTTNHPIEFGMVCAMAVSLAVHYLFQARERGEPVRRWVVCLCLVGLGAMLSLSRTAILGLVTTGVVLAITLPRERKLPVLAVGGTFFMLASAVIPGLFGTLRGMFSNIGSDPSVKARTADYTDAWQQVYLHPIAGRGFGTYLPDKYSILDNQYLLTLIENGYLGLFAMIGLFLAGCYAAIRARRLSADPALRGIAACLICGILIGAVGAATFDLLSFGVATGVLFVLIGTCGAALRLARTEAAAQSTQRREAVAS
jgi:O-antigen ligase